MPPAPLSPARLSPPSAALGRRSGRSPLVVGCRPPARPAVLLAPPPGPLAGPFARSCLLPGPSGRLGAAVRSCRVLSARLRSVSPAGKLCWMTARRMPPVIRALDAADVDAVCRVLGLARLHQQNGSYLVAWDGDEPIGHAYLTITDPPEMQDVEVRANFQRRGVARHLIAAVEAAAVENGADRLRVSVSISNEAALGLYHKLGFSDTGLPPRLVRGTIQIRTGPIEVDDMLLTWEKYLAVPK